MPDLGRVAGPSAPITTERLLLREPTAADRAALMELRASPEVYAYLGGPRSGAELEAAVPVVPVAQPGLWVVDLDGEAIGTVTLTRRDLARPGHVRPVGEELELSYLLLARAWGHGYAREACSAVLTWVDGALPGEPVVVCTQVANLRSLRLASALGFVEVGRFEEFGAEQWFGVRRASA